MCLKATIGSLRAFLRFFAPVLLKTHTLTHSLTIPLYLSLLYAPRKSSRLPALTNILATNHKRNHFKLCSDNGSTSGMLACNLHSLARKTLHKTTTILLQNDTINASRLFFLLFPPHRFRFLSQNAATSCRLDITPHWSYRERRHDHCTRDLCLRHHRTPRAAPMTSITSLPGRTKHCHRPLAFLNTDFDAECKREPEKAQASLSIHLHKNTHTHTDWPTSLSLAASYLSQV